MKQRTLGTRIKRHHMLYLFIAPAFIYFIAMHVIPYYGLIIAFKDFSPVRGVFGSAWSGLDNYERLFNSPDFYRLFRNTVLISLYKLLFGFPAPIVFALILNEIRKQWFKRSVQTITYFPHFLSWVVFGGIVTSFLTPSGVINSVLQSFELKPVDFLVDPRYFRSIVVVTDIMKEYGWSAIIYLAALTGINPELYESARIDGANRFRQLLHVTLPGIMSTISLMFIIHLAFILDAGFNQIYVLINPAVYEVGDIIDTYVYRVGLERGDFSKAAAVGLVNSLIGFLFVLSANFTLRKLGQRSIW